jgi:hypothetical protein
MFFNFYYVFIKNNLTNKQNYQRNTYLFTIITQ